MQRPKSHASGLHRIAAAAFYRILMRVALTADLHLRSKKEYPERYGALANILSQLATQDIDMLIVAGDLFDANLADYSDFERLSSQYPAVQIHIIPGNHDTLISEEKIVGENIHIYTEPSVLVADSTTFLLIPYDPKATMAEKLAHTAAQIAEQEWILVGHGDYMECTHEPTSAEPGVYMPLSRPDLDRYAPTTVILGHIHRTQVRDNVHYVGSPQGLDISETGRRTYALFDTTSGIVTNEPVASELLYFRESFVIAPVDNDASVLRQQIKTRVEGWGLAPSEHDCVKVRVEASGFTANRKAILRALKTGFNQYSLYDDGPRIDHLYISADYQRNALAQRVQELVNAMQWDFGGDEPDRDEVLIAALHLVYGS